MNFRSYPAKWRQGAAVRRPTWVHDICIILYILARYIIMYIGAVKFTEEWLNLKYVLWLLFFINTYFFPPEGTKDA